MTLKNIIVRKYGGSSLADTRRLETVAEQIASARESGDGIVVVVSAMGGTTDQLLHMAGEVGGSRASRELDLLLATGEQVSASLLAMSLRRLGADAVALTGAQAGIRTAGPHFNARVESVHPQRVLEELACGRVVVVTGFQGLDGRGELTTLGRGGSDISAIALAAALHAHHCEILSDVDGVYSADPRVVSDAERLASLTHDEMIALARHGARVLNERAVRYAREHGVDIRAGSAFGDEGETFVRRSRETESGPRIIGVAGHSEVLWLRQPVADDGKGARETKIREALRKVEVFLEHGAGRFRDLLLPLAQIAASDASAIARALSGVGHVHEEVATVSAIGQGVGTLRSVRDAGSSALRDVGIDVRETFASNDYLTCVVAAEHANEAVRAFHDRLRDQASGLAEVA